MSCEDTLSKAAFGKSSSCSSDSGYSFYIITDVPTPAQMESICASPVCMQCIEAMKAAVPGECTVSWMSVNYQVYAQIFNPIAAVCAKATTAPPPVTPAPTTKAPTTVAQTTTTVAPTTTTEAPTTTTVAPTTSTVAPTTTTIAPAAGNITEAPSVVSDTPSTTTSTAASGSSSGMNSTVVIVLVAAVVIVVIVIAFIIGRSRSSKRKRQSSFQDVEYSPAGGIGHATNGTYVQDHYPTGASSATASTNSSAAGARTRSSKAFKSKVPDGVQGGVVDLWSDRAIQRARIPLEEVTLGKELSRGAFGQVLRGFYADKPVAVKRLLPARRKDMKEIQNFLEEAKLMTTLKHPRIVKLVGVAWDSLADLCVVSEFMDGGDLSGLMAKYQANHEPQGFTSSKVKIAMHVVHALSYLHGLKPTVLHRDLKSKNILLTSELDAKLTDFGVSREQANVQLTAGVGSSLWMAPEVMIGDPYDEKADIFSFGVVLSELDTHQLPYYHAREPGSNHRLPEIAILQMVSSGELQVAFSPNADPDMVETAQACMALDPRDRPTANEVLHRLHHLWKYYGGVV